MKTQSKHKKGQNARRRHPSMPSAGLGFIPGGQLNPSHSNTSMDSMIWALPLVMLMAKSFGRGR